MGEWEKGDYEYPYAKDGVNWDAATHQQLWDWFSEPRLQEMEAWVDSLTHKVAAHFQAAADKVDQALRAAGVHWEGAAADAMKDSATPLAQHALLAKDAATQAGVTTLSQFMHAKNMAMAIPEPQPAPDQNIFLAAQGGDLAQYFQDVSAHEAAANEAEARARDLARSYDTAAGDAATSLPRFEQAPAATVSRTEPTDVIEVDGTGPEQDAGPGGPGPGAGPGPEGSPRPSSGPGDPGQSGGPTTGSAPPPGGRPADSTSGQSWAPQAQGPGTSGGPGLPGDIPRSTTAAPLIVTGGPGGTGAMPRGSTGAPGGSGSGQPAGGSRQPVAGPGSGVRGAPVGEGPLATRGTAATTGRGAGGAGMGMAPVGTNRKDDEDAEHNSPEYLRDFHDDFWDDTPPVAPAVIGDEDDD
jgi:hypothetical protein